MSHESDLNAKDHMITLIMCINVTANKLKKALNFFLEFE